VQHYLPVRGNPGRGLGMASATLNHYLVRSDIDMQECSAAQENIRARPKAKSGRSM
jgi:hypothetical protein